MRQCVRDYELNGWSLGEDSELMSHDGFSKKA